MNPHSPDELLALVAQFMTMPPCPPAPPGCHFEGVVIKDEQCYCVYTCGGSVFFQPCP